MEAIKDGIGKVISTAGDALRYLPEPASGAANFLQSIAKVSAGDTSAISGDTGELINKQIELQREMLQVTLFSNVERTRHETSMAPARNVRLA